jgi:hypothetical protein
MEKLQSSGSSLKNGISNSAKLRKARFSKFKEIMVKYPQTTAYSTAFSISSIELVRKFHTIEKADIAAITVLSMCNALAALAREGYYNGGYKMPPYTRTDKLVPGTIAATGFIAGTGLILTGEASGMTIGVATTMIALLYNPIRNILTNKLTTFMHKTKKIASVLLMGVGIAAFSTGVSPVEASEILEKFSIEISKNWRTVADYIAVGTGIALVGLGFKGIDTLDKKELDL